jgi:hypothetical protein
MPPEVVSVWHGLSSWRTDGIPYALINQLDIYHQGWLARQLHCRPGCKEPHHGHCEEKQGGDNQTSQDQKTCGSLSMRLSRTRRLTAKPRRP